MQTPDEQPESAPEQYKMTTGPAQKRQLKDKLYCRDRDKIAAGVQQELQTARRPWYYIARKGRFLLTVYILVLALFAVLAGWVHVQPILPIDVAITHEIQRSRSPWLSAVMLAVSYLGNALWLFTGLIALTVILLWILRLRLEAVLLAFVCLTSALLNVTIKLLVERPRPAQPLVSVLQHATGHSFPSGHVMSYVTYWGLIFSFSIMLFSARRWWRTTLLIISGLFVILVGPSRIYLGDHWASDVLGAYIFGGLWLWLCLWAYMQLKERGVLAAGWRPGRHQRINPQDRSESER